MRLGSNAVSDEPPLDVQDYLVSRSVECQNSLQLCLELAIFSQLADRVLRLKSNFRIFFNFENAFPHPVVTRSDAAVAAPSIDNDRAASFSSGEISFDGSVLELECSVSSMESAGQSKLDQGFRRIELKCSRQRISRHGPVREGQYNQNDCERA